MNETPTNPPSKCAKIPADSRGELRQIKREMETLTRRLSELLKKEEQKSQDKP